MKKLLRITLTKLFCLFIGALCGALVSIAPVALIHHKDLSSYFSCLHWSAIIFFSLSILTGGVLCFLMPSFLNKKVAMAIGYLFFYTACVALCQRIGLTSLSQDTHQSCPNLISIASCPLTIIPSLIAAITGILLICLAAVHFVIAAIKESQPKGSQHAAINNKKISRYSNLNWLLFMSGIPLIFGVWLPLIAMPGAWVITRWLD